MDQNFKLLNDQITKSNDSVKKLQEHIYRDVSPVSYILTLINWKNLQFDFSTSHIPKLLQQKVKPAESCLNGVTVVLLFLWFIVLYYGKKMPSPSLFVVVLCGTVCMNSVASTFISNQPTTSLWKTSR